jgi:putative SOS response-associated peptidase YedK
MCGRFVSSSSPDQIAAYFGAEPPTSELPPSFNVAPTNDIYAVVEGADGVRRVEVFHWGLVPSWAKDTKIGSKMINARGETLMEKPAFKSLFKVKRCIVPMDGFYEWKAGTEGGPTTAKGKPAKQPHFIHRLDGEPLAVAGLWAAWRDREAGPDAPWLHSCTVITTSANATMAPVHDRMPVILGESDWATWLDPENNDLIELNGLLVPASDGLLTMHPVSTDVNKVANKGPQLVEPVETADAVEPKVAEPEPGTLDL